MVFYIATLFCYLYLINEVEKLKKQYRRKKRSVAGLETDFAIGFVLGLKEQFEEQKSKNREWRLVLSVPKEVEDAYNNKNFSNRKFKGSSIFVNNKNISTKVTKKVKDLVYLIRLLKVMKTI